MGGNIDKETRDLKEILPGTPFSPMYRIGSNISNEIIEDVFKRANEMKGYGTVPLGVIQNILFYSDVCEVFSMSESCKLFNLVCNSRQFWEEYYHHFYRIPYEVGKVKRINWKKQFRIRYFARDDQFYRRRYVFRKIMEANKDGETSTESEKKEKKKKKKKKNERSIIPLIIGIGLDVDSLGVQVMEEYFRPLFSQYFHLGQAGFENLDITELKNFRLIFTYETKTRQPVDISVKLMIKVGRSYARSSDGKPVGEVPNIILRFYSKDNKESKYFYEKDRRREARTDSVVVVLRSESTIREEEEEEVEGEEYFDRQYGFPWEEPKRAFDLKKNSIEGMLNSFGVAIDHALTNLKKEVLRRLEEKERESLKHRLKTAPGEFLENVEDMFGEFKDSIFGVKQLKNEKILEGSRVVMK